MKKLVFFLVAVSFFKMGMAQYSNANWQGSIEPTKSFIENKSQFDGRVSGNNTDILFAYDGGTTQVYFTKNGLVCSFVKFEPKEKEENEQEARKENMSAEEYKAWEKKEHQKTCFTDMLAIQWENANPNVEVIGINQTDDYHNYAVNDKSINHISAYHKLLYKNIYPGIDLEYTFHPISGLKYAFLIHPGAAPSLISIKYPASRNVDIDTEGNALISTLFGNITDHKPTTYYMDGKAVIPSNFSKHGNRLGFEVHNYDATKEIVIDPWFDTPSIPNSNAVWECEKDPNGNVYIIGGDSPMRLRKYSSSGAIEWTYSTPYDTANYWLGTMAVDTAGNSYVTGGSSAGLQKIDSTGAMIYSVSGSPWDEYWNIAFNCDQSVMAIGGTRLGNSPPTNSQGMIYEINPANGSVIATRVVGAYRTETVFGSSFFDIEEVRSIAMAGNSRYYFLTLDTIGSVDQDLSACLGSGSMFQDNHGYHFGYKSEFYRPNNGNSGIMAIRASANYVYTHNGITVHKRSLFDGSILGSATIPGGINTVFNQTLNQPGNNGIDIDNCGNVYVGSGNAIVKYDADLNLLSSVSLPFSVFDVAVSYNGDVIVAGATGNSSSTNRTGYVQSINMSACAPQVLECCNANICPPSTNICNDETAVTLNTTGTAGTWSGTGVNPSGVFNPSLAGVGTHTITNTLSCGSDSINIVVNPCINLQICLGSNGELTATNGVGPFTWERDSIYLDCSSCSGGTCIPFFCPGDTVTAWSSLASGASLNPPFDLPVRLNDSDGNMRVISTFVGLPGCNCALSTSFSDAVNVSCHSGSDGSVTAQANNSNGTVSYVWSNGQTTATATELEAGTYTVTVSDNTCVSVNQHIITEAPMIYASTTSTQSDCGQPTGTATVIASGGTGALTYAWNTNPLQTDATATGLVAGTYTVTITDANGCERTSTIPVINASNFSVTISESDNLLVASGGVSFKWYFNGDIIAGADSASYYATETGAYYVVAADSNGCQALSNLLQLYISNVEDRLLDGLKVYPNPASEILIVSGDMPLGLDLGIEIYSATGQLVYQFAINTAGQSNHIQIPVSKLSNGIYLLRLQLGRNEKQERIIISR